ncbi:tRNA (adenine(58)-N(1))-methyltransferase non-catalytic subunit trm6 [Lecanosticta acicola]|uniref:tRNA (adenine(58)-N(1))-methyltransferase non-catalytic subunit TRM6 n=1 Tax=Lecanosticta acicola TaxID=111012 RepID=A0AAI8YW12_9PEZI|nr:tRNA (adenine(58)-N(1))-methyltransferase non-catalytic subunit trm6 [Lecanosticta acicola]
MSATHSHIRPNTYLFLRLLTETLKLVEIKLNTIVEVGKLGSFPSNLLVGRPYYHTYEILEKKEGELYSRLRIVPPAELHAEAGLDDAPTPTESREDTATPVPGDALPTSHDLLSEEEAKNNRLTVDDASRQQLTHAAIEELKKSAGGKEVIERILANHKGLDEKTAFAKAKYMARKNKKYLKRFTALPMDLGELIDYVMEKEPPRIMEMREEALGLVGAWSHAHFSSFDVPETGKGIGGRWLVIDEAGGLVVAGLAERMNLLYPPLPKDKDSKQSNGALSADNGDGDVTMEENQPVSNGTARSAKPSHRDFPPPATTNSITLLHPAVQPNLSLLKYFGYDTSNPERPGDIEEEHPLHTHLKHLSWLQLLHPEEDPTYTEPESVTEDVLASWKSGKRGNYYKKRRRWSRCKAIVDETRAGGFEGLVIASHMDPVSILEHTVSLVRGGGHIIIYSPTIEPLVKAVDMYSKERRSAYIAHLSKGEIPDAEDFPVDPRLLLAPSVQTSRVREWQVLPGRTHPLMTSRGGAEGYVFTARRAIPLEGGVEARGVFSAKKRRVAATNTSTEDSTATTATPS